MSRPVFSFQDIFKITQVKMLSFIKPAGIDFIHIWDQHGIAAGLLQ